MCSPTPDFRTLIAVAHPDDETLGTASLLPHLSHNVTLLHFTDGSPYDGADAAANGFSSREQYAAQRRRELESALALANISPDQFLTFNCPDQQLSHHLAPLARRLAARRTTLLPAVLITHPYERGHPDHDAAAFIAHAARQLVPLSAAPVVIEMTSYHAGPQGIETNTFLDPNSPSPAIPADACTCDLSPEQLSLKQKMLAAFITQQSTLQQFALSPERFRLARCYNFAQPPHPGKLFYENFPWGMTAAKFCALTQQALADLHLEPSL